jgi:hypothetical protein
MYLYEAINPLQGLPKHWIKFLTEKHGKQLGSTYGKDMAGENSHVEELRTTKIWEIKDVLKDDNILAVIGRLEAKPLFMAAKHDGSDRQYYMFEVTPSSGRHSSKSVRRYNTRSGRSPLVDHYSLKDVLSVIEELKGDTDFSGITFEKISKDPERGSKIEKRLISNKPTDPYESPGTTGYSKSPLTTPKQKEIIKKYGELKRKKLDIKVDEEIEKIKNQVVAAIPGALATAISSVKRGYSYNISNVSIAKEIAQKINIDNLTTLAQAYRTLELNYSDTTKPSDVAANLKKLGMI